MVYMAADKNAELDTVAVRDLREMESGANDDTHVVGQINRAWPDSFQRYESSEHCVGRLVQRLDTADAVRQASLSLLHDLRARLQSTHPFYWAGFVAAGDWH